MTEKPKARISEETFDDFLASQGLLAVCEEQAIAEFEAPLCSMQRTEKKRRSFDKLRTNGSWG